MRLNLDRLMGQASKLRRKGDLAQASQLYLTILDAYPGNQRASKALEQLRAEAVDPPMETLKALESLYQKGEFAGVAETGERLAQDFPRSFTLWNIIGAANQALGRTQAAEENFRRALDINPQDADAHNNLGVILKAQNRTGEAFESYQRATLSNPNHADALVNLGNLVKDTGHVDDALTYYAKAQRINPGDATIYYNIAGTLQEKGEVEESVRHYLRALELAPDYNKARAQLLHQLAHLCDWDRLQSFSTGTATLGIVGEPVEPFALLFLEDSPSRQRIRSERFAAKRFEASPLPIPIRTVVPRKNLRIGYFSADFHSHATMYLLSQVLLGHDRSSFEIYIYSYGAKQDEWITPTLKNAVTRFQDVRELSDLDLAGLARRDALDIAVDLKGYTRNSRSGIFSHRLAPIQISYLGYPGTMGARFIDYIVADDVVIPPSHREHYTENVIYLPHSYQPTDNSREIPDKPSSRQQFGLPPDGFVFCCFNATYKITLREFAIWMRLLGKVDGSVLWLLRSNKWAEANLRAATKAHGIDESRLVFAERQPHLEHLARHRHADLFLDTFNVNAHTTASDALWAGLPIVTRMGEQFAARVAASVLHAAGLPELITDSDEAYERLALDLATDRCKLDAIKQKLADNRLTQPLFDSRRYTKHLEAAYRQACQRYIDGKSVDTIRVEDDRAG